MRSSKERRERRDLSRPNVRTLAAWIRPRSLKWSSRYRLCREALGLMSVFAFPKESRSVERDLIWSASLASFFECVERRRI